MYLNYNKVESGAELIYFLDAIYHLFVNDIVPEHILSTTCVNILVSETLFIINAFCLSN